MIPASEAGNGGDYYAEWDAAYVLGALSPSDRRAYERHLAECDACRAAVAELAGMPGLLSTISPAHAEALVAEGPGTAELPDGGPAGPAGPGGDSSGDSGAELAPVIPLAGLARAARRSRVRRRTLGAVAASALVIAGTVGGSVFAGGLFGSPDDVGTTPPSAAAADARTVELRPVDGANMRAEVVATPTDYGTKLEWRCHYPPKPGQEQPDGGGYVPPEPIKYELVLVGRDGGRTVAATWTWSGGVSPGLDASSAVPLTDMDRIEITLDGQEEALARATL